MSWRWIGAPLAVMYGGVIALRHLLYDEHVLPTYTPHIPTICVGNLAVGGTGKTPMVEFLIRLLRREGYKVCVLSRGYKRTTRGFVIATSSATAETIGDEAMQIHRKFPDVLTVVCEERALAIRKLQRMHNPPDVILLDDAYQHRAIRCGLTILLTAYDRLYVNDHLLPWGSLRDIPYFASKANIIVVTKCPDTIRPIDKRVVDSKLRPATFQHLYFSRMQYADVPVKGVPLVVTGIAQPEYMIAHIRSIEPQTEVLTYPDHHRFTPADVNEIIRRAERCDCVLTTEKDMQRFALTDIAERLSKPIIPLPIRMTVDQETRSFDDDVLTYVRESKHKQSL
ncbi:MAG: tetraacyldisaccharide 4'-kinase [Paludibacteraceae bacterium]|nr:tetraacyldisaccharide 4'-kinase [Paludibacteraceae bacterium]